MAVTILPSFSVNKNKITDINEIYFVFQTARWSALLVGIIYGKRRYGKNKQGDLKQ